ncbi:MAG: trypsin-like serine protease [Aliishimia sp.]
MTFKYIRQAVLSLFALTLAAPVAVSAQSDTGLRALDTDHEARGWEAVGRLDTGSGYCTGTLIAPHLVLTAAHCVYDLGNGKATKAEKFTFRAGFRNGEAAATRQVSRVAAHPGFDPSAAFNSDNVSHDLALIELSKPIPSSEINPFALHDERVSPGEVSVVSYGRGRSEVQSRQRGCEMLERQRNLMAFDCDVTKGSSGAPVFSHLNGRGRILSVISGEVTIDGREVALGMHLPPLIDELKRELVSTNTGPVAQVKRVQAGQRSGGAFQSKKRVSGAKFVRAPGS